jgi:hypothetical protein
MIRIQNDYPPCQREKTVEVPAITFGILMITGLITLLAFFVCFFALIIALCR